ncbi:MAG: hypothetical protein ACRDHZ_00015 [Ktedonobacteraceae bacterium]
MPERPYARYTREKTWHALDSQAINACYALVPNSATNNSIWLLRCKSPEETQATMAALLGQIDEIEIFFANKPTKAKKENEWAQYNKWLAQRPACLKNAGEAVVLAKSSDYWHYHLEARPAIALVVCSIHDSYLHLPVWETHTNRRYTSRDTALAIGSPEFVQNRRTQQAHNTLIGSLAAGEKTALAYLKTLPDRTQRRLRLEADTLQANRYRGRPLAFYTDAERLAIGAKISEALVRYHNHRSTLNYTKAL